MIRNGNPTVAHNGDGRACTYDPETRVWEYIEDGVVHRCERIHNHPEVNETGRAYDDVDKALLAFADNLSTSMGDRLRALVAADGMAGDVVALRDRAERAEDLVAELRRQLTSLERQVGSNPQWVEGDWPRVVDVNLADPAGALDRAPSVNDNEIRLPKASVTLIWSDRDGNRTSVLLPSHEAQGVTTQPEHYEHSQREIRVDCPGCVDLQGVVVNDNPTIRKPEHDYLTPQEIKAGFNHAGRYARPLV